MRPTQNPTFSSGAFAAALLVLSPLAAAQPEYTVQEIPRPPDTYILFPIALNNTGEAVGYVMFNEPGGLTHSWRWSPAAGTTVLPEPPGNGLRNRANDINDAGVIVGDGYDNGGLPWLFQNGQYTIIQPWAAMDAGRATSVTASGRVVGLFYGGISVGNRGFALAPGQAPQNLTPDHDNQITSINDRGVMVGAFGSTDGFVIDEAGVLTSIPDLDPTWSRMGVAKVNNSGLVLGNSAPYFGGNTSLPYLYTVGGSPLPLPQLAALTVGRGLNDNGEAVGSAQGSGGTLAWVYTSGQGMRDLNALVDPALGFHLMLATDINNRGQILAHATKPGDTFRHVLLLTPIAAPPPPCYANCDGSASAPILNVQDFTCFLQKFASADAYANCDGSATEPTLNVLDFSCFLQQFAAGCP